MTPRRAGHVFDPHLLPEPPVPGRDRLTLVSSRVDVHRTFADAEATRRSGSLWRRTTRRVPAGMVHAADLLDDATLCGLALQGLHEFGRSRYPFERFDESRRCRACHLAAGRPTA